MSKKKETFTPLHWDELTLEEQQETERLLRGEPSSNAAQHKRDRYKGVTKSIIQNISNEIIIDIAPLIRVLQYNAKEIVKIKNRTEKRLSRLSKELSKLVLEALAEGNK